MASRWPRVAQSSVIPRADIVPGPRRPRPATRARFPRKRRPVARVPVAARRWRPACIRPARFRQFSDSRPGRVREH
jgi:hypothetical protein